jgi:hypothetical protein
VSVTYNAVLDVSEDSVLFLSALLHAERICRGTSTDTRALGTYKQAMPALRWLFDDTRISHPARDNGIGVSTAYAYRDEAITVLAARKPSLRGALLAAKAAGHTHVILDGSLIYTDRNSTPGPTRGVDLWWSGKHHHHGGNIQVVSAPTAGRCGPRRCARAASTTPPPPAPTPTSSTTSPPRSPTATSARPTWATKARPTCSASRSRNPPTAS